MESILLCLKKSFLKQNHFLQKQIYIEILDFLTNCVSPEDRNLLIEQLCQGDVIATLNEGLTSNLETLLVILKLLCNISENPKFLEGFWEVLKNIARALVFLTKSAEFPEVQVEFVEVMFMVEILLKRFQHNIQKNKISEDDIWTLKSLLTMCESVFKNPVISKPCKFSVVLLFTQNLLILKRSEVLFNENRKSLVHSVLEIFYTVAECCLSELDVEKGYIVNYLVIKVLINITSFHTSNEYDRDCFLQFLVHLFKNYFWKFLFEDTKDIPFADFLVTTFNEILWTVWKICKKTVFQISRKLLQQNGIERLIIFLKETPCSNILKTRTKLLITITVTAAITNQYVGKRDSLISNSLFHGDVERFVNLKQVACNTFNDTTKSFIHIFSVIMKHGKDNCIEYFPTVLRKISSIVKYIQVNRISITPTEFWSALSIYQVCCTMLEEETVPMEVDQKLLLEVNGIFKSMCNEEFCTISLNDSEQLAWLKKCNENLFERNIAIYLDQRLQDISTETNKTLLKLITPSRILHLVFSNSYNQIINSSKIISQTRLSVEDENYLLNLADISKISDPTQILALLFIFEQNVSLLTETSVLLKFCKQLLDSKLYSGHNEELKASLIRLIARVVIKNHKLIKVNYWIE